MRVLEHACRLCRSGGLVLDLTTIRPAASVEAGGTVLGRLDQTVFLERAAITEQAVEAAIAAGALVEEARVDLDVLKRFDTSGEAVADIGNRPVTRLPDDLRHALAHVSTPIVERSRCRLRRLRIVGGESG